MSIWRGISGIKEIRGRFIKAGRPLAATRGNRAIHKLRQHSSINKLTEVNRQRVLNTDYRVPARDYLIYEHDLSIYTNKKARTRVHAQSAQQVTITPKPLILSPFTPWSAVEYLSSLSEWLKLWSRRRFSSIWERKDSLLILNGNQMSEIPTWKYGIPKCM